MLFPENIRSHISIDEVALSSGELYTFVTAKGVGKKKCLIASILGTKSETLIEVLNKIPLEKRSMVREITLDMAKNMESAALKSFPKAVLVTDRFHVVKLVSDALQHLRIKYRWEAIDQENQKRSKTKKLGKRFRNKYLENGETKKQLLARSRYILAKDPSKWTVNQKQRAKLLFKLYPTLEKGFKHLCTFKKIYETENKHNASIKIDQWLEEGKSIEIKEFNTASQTIERYKETILNFFNNRSTNAAAESFNAKIKLFRANLRGVNDVRFFLFRLGKLFA